MYTLTLILLIVILIFLIGNILLAYQISLRKKREKVIPLNSDDVKIKVLKSKVDLLHERVSRLEKK